VKVATVERSGVPRPWAIAYTDSLSDLPMLRAAEAAKLINPSPKVEKKAAKALGGKLEVLHWF
jgi:phosphatidylglycerophosphatase C